MKFDVQNQELEGKLKSLPGLRTVLRDLDANTTRVSEEPAERVVLPYSGQKPLRSDQWIQTPRT